MKFDTANGRLDLPAGFSMYPGITHDEVLATATEWEPWSEVDSVPTALKTIIKLPNNNMSPRTILIVRFAPADHAISGWDILPSDLGDGSGFHRAGKYVKRLRRWFEDMFDAGLPCGAEWGHVDVHYDSREKSGGVVCLYREAFADDREWVLYKHSHKF